MTQSKTEISEFTKIITFMSPEVIVGLIMICLLMYAVFVKDDGYAKAALQVTRLVICVGVWRPPKVDSMRIFLCMALILFLNINALFQSHLSSLLTVPIYKRDINSIEDLKVRITNLSYYLLLFDTHRQFKFAWNNTTNTIKIYIIIIFKNILLISFDW